MIIGYKRTPFYRGIIIHCHAKAINKGAEDCGDAVWNCSRNGGTHTERSGGFDGHLTIIYFKIGEKDYRAIEKGDT